MFERSIMKDLRKWADNPYRKLSIDKVQTIEGKSFRLVNLPFIYWLLCRRYCRSYSVFLSLNWQGFATALAKVCQRCGKGLAKLFSDCQCITVMDDC